MPHSGEGRAREKMPHCMRGMLESAAPPQKKTSYSSNTRVLLALAQDQWYFGTHSRHSHEPLQQRLGQVPAASYLSRLGWFIIDVCLARRKSNNDSTIKTVIRIRWQNVAFYYSLSLPPSQFGFFRNMACAFLKKPKSRQLSEQQSLNHCDDYHCDHIPLRPLLLQLLLLLYVTGYSIINNYQDKLSLSKCCYSHCRCHCHCYSLCGYNQCCDYATMQPLHLLLTSTMYYQLSR